MYNVGRLTQALRKITLRDFHHPNYLSTNCVTEINSVIVVQCAALSLHTTANVHTRFIFLYLKASIKRPSSANWVQKCWLNLAIDIYTHNISSKLYKLVVSV